MNILKVLFGFACLIAAFNVQTAHAQVVFADRTSFDAAFPTASQENWDSYTNGTVINNGQTVNGITYNVNSGAGAALVTNAWLNTTNPNSLAETANGYFIQTDTLTLTFAQPLTAFGIDINTYSTDTGDYTATLSNGAIVNSSFDPFPGWSTGEFIGFSDPASFDSITIQAGPDGDAYNLDTLQFVDAPSSPSVVPEPSTIALMIVGLMGMAVFTIRRKMGGIIQC